jgi:hypothetical protein
MSLRRDPGSLRGNAPKRGGPGPPRPPILHVRRTGQGDRGRPSPWSARARPRRVVRAALRRGEPAVARTDRPSPGPRGAGPWAAARRAWAPWGRRDARVRGMHGHAPGRRRPRTPSHGPAGAPAERPRAMCRSRMAGRRRHLRAARGGRTSLGLRVPCGARTRGVPCASGRASACQPLLGHRKAGDAPRDRGPVVRSATAQGLRRGRLRPGHRPEGPCLGCRIFRPLHRRF